MDDDKFPSLCYFDRAKTNQVSRAAEISAAAPTLWIAGDRDASVGEVSVPRHSNKPAALSDD